MKGQLPEGKGSVARWSMKGQLPERKGFGVWWSVSYLREMVLLFGRA